MHFRFSQVLASLLVVVLSSLMMPSIVAGQVGRMEASGEGRGTTAENAILSALANVTEQTFGFRLEQTSSQASRSIARQYGRSSDSSAGTKSVQNRSDEVSSRSSRDDGTWAGTLQTERGSVSSSNSQAALTVGEETRAFVEAANRAIIKKTSLPESNPILGFSVDWLRQESQARWIAKVTIQYARYSSPSANDRRQTLVVNDGNRPALAGLNRLVEEALLATGRFNILSRTDRAAFDSEREFIKGADAGRQEVARTGQAMGADYILVVEVSQFSSKENQREVIRLTNEIITQSGFQGLLSLRLFEFSSRRLVWSSSIRFSELGISESRITHDILVKALEAPSRSLVSALVDHMFPILVLKQDGAHLVINRGQGAVVLGQRFSVFASGDELKDPQTGELLGRHERHVATGVIADVRPKFSVLRLNSRPASEMPTDLVIRPQASLQTGSAEVGVGPPNSGDVAPAPQAPRRRSLLED